MRPLIAAFVTSFLAAGLTAALPAPKVPIASFEQLPRPLPLPYDENADAMTAVNKARARAIAGRKLLLIDLGGNWCGDCRVLAGVMALPAVEAWTARHYEVVTVDVGRFDKNLAIPAHYGITQRLEGVPSLLVIEPRKDRMLNGGRTAALASARSMTPQGLADYLAAWAR